MLIIFRKIFLISIFLIFTENNLVFGQTFNICNEKNSNISSLFKKKKIELININVNNYRAWQVNNIRILTNNTHVIPDDFKKRFNADIKIDFFDESECSYKARVRTQGDLKDHIIYKDGQVYQSLDISLENGHVNNITKFKLFLKGTRGVEEDEVFMTELLRELGFLAPRTEIVDVKINGQKLRMLFQEKISKELLEYNKRREGPILEGDEKYMMKFISKVKNNPGINWAEIFRLSDLGTKIQLSKQTNSNWSIRNETFTKIAIDSLKKLNFIYLVYLNSYHDKKNNYSFLHYNLDNTLLAQNDVKNLKKLNIYNNILIAASGEHGLYVHNRKFYWNPIENYFEPIYYDGEFDLEKKVKKLHFPLSLEYAESVNTTIDLIKSLDKKRLLINLKNRNLILDEKKLNIKINNLLSNLDLIKKMFNEKNKDDLIYNLISYKNKDLFYNYVNNLEKENIKYKLVKYQHNKDEDKPYAQICKKNLVDCNESIYLDLRMKRDLLEGKLNIKGYNYQLIDNNGKLEKYKKIVLNDDSFKDVLFVYNKGINYEYDEKNKKFNINQIDLNGRSFFLEGKIKNISIHFNGIKNQYSDEIIKYDHNNLTGCLSFIKSKFDEISLSATYINCEDGINLINTSGSIKNVNVNNTVLDGIDLDFSDVLIKDVKINNAGNDCIDLSSGDYVIEILELKNCGDKGISIGEKSLIKIKNLIVDQAVVGIASKDSSVAYIDKAEIDNTKECLTAYRKKQEFDGGYLKINNSDCKNYKNLFYFDQFSKIDIVNEL